MANTGSWSKRSSGGIYRRVAGDGQTVVAAITKGPYDAGQGAFRTGWNVEVYPKGEGNGHHVFRYGYPTLAHAKVCAEAAFRQARKDLAQGMYPA